MPSSPIFPVAVSTVHPPLGCFCSLYIPKSFPVRTIARVFPLRRHLLSGLAENNRATHFERILSHHRVTDDCPDAIPLPALPLICFAITIEGVSRVILARLIKTDDFHASHFS